MYYYFRSLSTILYRQRSKSMPPLPTSVDSMVVPSIFQLTESGEKFFIVKEAISGERIIGFCSKVGLKILFEAEDIFIDGTFDSCPNPFTQVITIHGLKSEVACACGFFLALSKKQITYTTMITCLKQIAVRDNKEFTPKNVHCDFEIALINAVKISIPKARCCGCYFHYSQALLRKCGKLNIKNKIYNTGPISKTYAMLKSMPFLPREYIQVNFTILLLKICYF